MLSNVPTTSGGVANENDHPALLSVLVVEDYADAADALAHLLCLHGHRVTVACTGVEALFAAEADPPDVVLLDLRLRDLDGWLVVRWLREQGGCKGG